jgi:hypothetical protein
MTVASRPAEPAATVHAVWLAELLVHPFSETVARGLDARARAAADASGAPAAEAGWAYARLAEAVRDATDASPRAVAATPHALLVAPPGHPWSAHDVGAMALPQGVACAAITAHALPGGVVALDVLLQLAAPLAVGTPEEEAARAALLARLGAWWRDLVPGWFATRSGGRSGPVAESVRVDLRAPAARRLAAPTGGPVAPGAGGVPRRPEFQAGTPPRPTPGLYLDVRFRGTPVPRVLVVAVVPEVHETEDPAAAVAGPAAAFGARRTWLLRYANRMSPSLARLALAAANTAAAGELAELLVATDGMRHTAADASADAAVGAQAEQRVAAFEAHSLPVVRAARAVVRARRRERLRAARDQSAPPAASGGGATPRAGAAVRDNAWGWYVYLPSPDGRPSAARVELADVVDASLGRLAARNVRHARRAGVATRAAGASAAQRANTAVAVRALWLGGVTGGLALAASLVGLVGDARRDAEARREAALARGDAPTAAAVADAVARRLAAGTTTLAPTRYRARRRVAVRADPDPAARPVGTLAAGDTLVERLRVGRWIAGDGRPARGGATLRGWVYLCGLELLPAGDR